MTRFISWALTGSDQVFPHCVGYWYCHQHMLLCVKPLTCVTAEEAKDTSAWEGKASGANCFSAFSWETACVLRCQEEVLCGADLWQV